MSVDLQAPLHEVSVGQYGAAYHALDRDDDATDALREALKLRPDLTVARNNLAYVLAHKAMNR